MKNKQISVFKAFILFWRNYFNFNGKSTFDEYWGWKIWQFAIVLGFKLVGAFTPVLNTIALYAFVIMLIPDITLTLRRLKDVGIQKSVREIIVLIGSITVDFSIIGLLRGNNLILFLAHPMNISNLAMFMMVAGAVTEFITYMLTLRPSFIKKNKIKATNKKGEKQNEQ